MSGDITFNLPLPTYLKKYLESIFGKNHRLTKTSWLGGIIINVLDKEFKRSGSVPKDTDYYTIIIPYEITEKHGFSISSAKIKRLQVLVRKIFLNELYGFINIGKASKLLVTDDKYDTIVKQNGVKAMHQFLEYHNISEDDLNPDSLYRQFLRDVK